MRRAIRQPGRIRRMLNAGRDVWKRFRGGYSQEMYSALAGLGGTVRFAGVKVDRATAFKLSAFLRGVTIISNYVGKTPTDVYSGRAVDVKHPGQSLVRWWARKDWLSAGEFQRILTIHALVAGNGYGYIDRDRSLGGMMRPQELRVLDPSCVVPFTKRGRMFYRVHHRNLKRQSHVVPAHDIIHIRGIAWDELCGLEPLELSGDSVGIGLAQQGFAGRFLDKNGAPSVVAEFPNPIDDDEWNQQRQRLGDAVRGNDAIVMDRGATVKPWNLTADQMQLLQSREFTIVDVANLLNMNASKLNGKTNVSYKSLEEDNRSFREDTLDPWFCQFEVQFRKLLQESEQLSESHHVEFRRFALTQTNLKERGEYLSKAIGGPWMRPNEGREVTGYPDVPEGDEFYPVAGASPDAGVSTSDGESNADADSNEGTSDERQSTPPTQAELDKPATDARKAQTAQIVALTRDCSRICKRLAKQATRAAKKSPQFMDWLGDLQARAEDIATELQPTLALCGRSNSTAIAELIVAELRTTLQDLYDTAKPEEFESQVITAAVRFEEAGSRLAIHALMA